MLGRYRVDPERDETYAPELTAFFYFLSALKPDRLSERMLTADQDFIVRALASDIVEFSRYQGPGKVDVTVGDQRGSWVGHVA